MSTVNDLLLYTITKGYIANYKEQFGRNFYFLQYLIPIIFLSAITGCDSNEPKPSSACSLNTISLTPPGTIYTAYYNSESKITEISNFSEDGWIGTTYEYDVKGNLAFASNWTFTYDNSNRLIQIGRPPSEFTENFTYNTNS
jgi:hypothetical protein